MTLKEYLTPELEIFDIELHNDVLLTVSTDEGDNDNTGGDYDPTKPLD